MNKKSFNTLSFLSIGTFLFFILSLSILHFSTQNVHLGKFLDIEKKLVRYFCVLKSKNLNYMNRIFSKQISKAIIDVLLVAGLFVSVLSSHHPASASWGSFHCMASMAWYALMVVHIWQHWRLTKALAKWKNMKRNIISSLTAILFILMTVSVILFIGGVNFNSLHVHHVIAHLFWMVIAIHVVTKAKSFVRLFKKK